MTDDQDVKAPGRRYSHATDDAPLYRVPKTLGGGVWPTYRMWEKYVVLDIAGNLVQFFDTDVTAIARPEGLPDWAIAVLTKVLEYEDGHGAVHEGWTCFDGVLNGVPRDAMAFLMAEREWR